MDILKILLIGWSAVWALTLIAFSNLSAGAGLPLIPLVVISPTGWVTGHNIVFWASGYVFIVWVAGCAIIILLCRLFYKP